MVPADNDQNHSLDLLIIKKVKTKFFGSFLILCKIKVAFKCGVATLNSAAEFRIRSNLAVNLVMEIKEVKAVIANT